MDWHPHDLLHCVDSDALGYAIAGMAAGVLIWYWVIASIWLKSMAAATMMARTVWGTLALIFVVCSIAGYVSWVVSIWYPRAGIVIRVAALITLNIACPLFVWMGLRHKFMAYGLYQRLGEHLADMHYESMTDEELGAMARQFLEEAKVVHTAEEDRHRYETMPSRELLGRAGVCLDILLDRKLSKHGA